MTTQQRDLSNEGSGSTAEPGGRFIEGGAVRNADGEVLAVSAPKDGAIPHPMAEAIQMSASADGLPPAAAHLISNNLSAVPGTGPDGDGAGVVPGSERAFGLSHAEAAVRAAGENAAASSDATNDAPAAQASAAAETTEGDASAESDADPATMTVADLEQHVAGVTDIQALRRLKRAEAKGKGRAGAASAIDARLAEIQER